MLYVLSVVEDIMHRLLSKLQQATESVNNIRASEINDEGSL